MSVLKIPLRSDVGSFEFSIEIENNIYFFELKYNARAERWILNIFNFNREALLLGIPLLTDTDLISQYPIEGLFENLIFMYDKLGLQRNATRDDLGKDIIMLYGDS